MPRPFRVGALLLLLLAGAAAAEALPGQPSPDRLLQDLASADARVRRVAEGWLYLLDETNLAAVEAVVVKSGRGRGFCDPLDQALLITGHRATTERYADVILSQLGSQNDFLARFTADELRPLAALVAKKLAREPNELVLRAGYWQDLARRSADPDLLRLVGDQIAKGTAIGGMPAGPFIAANAKRLAGGSVDERERLLRGLAFGWHTAPTREFEALIAQREPRLRDAALASLAGSTAPEALVLAQKLLRDADQATRRRAAEAVLTFRPSPTDAVKALALDPKVEPDQRATGWRQLAGLEDAPVNEARGVVEREQEPLAVRQAAIELLARRKQGAWLMEHLPRLPEELQATALQQLADAGDEVLAPVGRFLDECEPAKAASVLSALAATRRPAALAVVIERLKDRRPEMRRAAAQALSRGTGLRGPEIADEPAAATEPAPRRKPAAGAVPPAPEPTAKQRREAEQAARKARQSAAAGADHAYTVWKAWWNRVHAPLDAAATAAHEEVRAILAADRDDDARRATTGEEPPREPLWSLARWAGDRSLGRRALRRLARHPDPAATACLVALLDDPGLAERRDEVADALARRPRDPAALAALADRIDDDDAAAVVVLIGWRDAEHAPALVDAALGRGVAFSRVRTGLIQWNPPVLAKAVRRYALAKPDDPEVRGPVRAAALALLVETATDADVHALAELAKRPGEGGEAVRALAQLAVGGSEPAVKEFAALLAVKHPAAPVALDAIAAAAPRSGKPVSDDAMESVPDAVLAQLRVLAREPSLATRAWTALVAWSDLLELDALRAFARETPEAVAGLVGALEARSPAAMPIAETLLAAPIEPQQARRVIAWMGRSGVDQKRCAALLAVLDRDKRRAFDATFGKPVQDICFIPEPIDEPWRPDSEYQVTVTIKNVGKKPVTMLDRIQVNVLTEDWVPLQGQGLPLELAAAATGAAAKNQLTIAPGRSVKTKLRLRLLGTAYNSTWATTHARLETHWRLVGVDDDHEQVQRSAWVACSFTPELWLTIDKRSTK